MRRRKVWQAYPERLELVQQMSAHHNLPPLIARLLLNRGLSDPEEVLAFLEAGLERLASPFDLPDLDVAAARLARAVRRREPVVVYGDYDADGLTAASLLTRFFQDLGLPCGTYIPNRLTEGYGLNLPALEKLAAQVRLLVTVDCGVSDVDEVAWARDHGLEVIITDHHELPPELPPAVAVVNPKRAGAAYPFEMLSGVGVALLLALGVRARLREEGWFKNHPEPNLNAYLDLVALGTAADVVPILGENRILVRQGLKVLESTRRPGLLALKEVAGINGRTVTFRDLGFRLAPRLNAAGRLGQALGALHLLLATDLNQARSQAKILNDLNRRRQSLEAEVLSQALNLVRQQGLDQRPVMVLGQEGWHPGVLGIVAARLVEAFHRPVAMVSLKDGLGKGSARSIPGYHLFRGLEACRQYFHKFGGHEAAAGFAIAEENLAALQAGLEETFLAQTGAARLRPCLKVDATVTLGDLDQGFFHHLQRLRPFGPGNPEPLFVCDAVNCLTSRVVGERHLRVQLSQDEVVKEAIVFDQAALHPLSGPLEVAFNTRFSSFMGQMNPEIQLLDWCRPGK
jgi:single-stranded-DNA-specific exonuclease